MLKSFNRPDQVEHATKWERGTLDNLKKQNSLGPALQFSLYGKTGHNVSAGLCSPQKIGSWSVTADNALVGLLDMADRHNHRATHEHLASIYKHSLAFVPRWSKEFGDYPGPGEYGVSEPCWSWDEMVEKRPNSDSDLDRHYGAAGLLMIGINQICRSIGGWSDDDIAKFAQHHLSSIVAKKPLGNGEILRFPYRVSGLVGCSRAFQSIGDLEKAKYAYNLAKSLCYLTLSPDIYWTKSKLGRLPSYGPWVFDVAKNDYAEPWRYGFYPWGGQSWYYGMISQELINLGLLALMRNDREFFSVCAQWIMDIAEWCDPRQYSLADDVPLNGPNDSVMMKNVLVHGGMAEGAPSGPYVTQQAIDQNLLLSVADYEALGPNDKFYRGNADKYFNADGKVWDTKIKLPNGNIVSRRKWSHGGYTAKMTTLDVLNAGGLLDALWVKAVMTNDQYLARYLDIRMSIDMGFGNSTDSLISLQKSIDCMGADGLATVGAPGRAWEWRAKAGMWGRGMLVGSPGNSETTPISTDATKMLVEEVMHRHNSGEIAASRELESAFEGFEAPEFVISE